MNTLSQAEYVAALDALFDAAGQPRTDIATAQRLHSRHYTVATAFQLLVTSRVGIPLPVAPVLHMVATPVHTSKPRAKRVRKAA